MPYEPDSPDDRSRDAQGPETSTRRLRARAQREFELEFFAKVLERDPFHADALRVHGNNLAARGEYNRALQIDRRLTRLQPEKPIPWYNLACTYAMLGMIEPAVAALQRALELGYRHFEHLVRDPDLKPLHRDPRFVRLLRRL
jgi:tetratricopeptide (TPR) repeat protein